MNTDYKVGNLIYDANIYDGLNTFLFDLPFYKNVSSTLAVSNIRNRIYTNCEVYLIDYGYGNFKEKIHFME